eukprot:CAMPEP_0119039910 /NCGR_PEP_ID=MMETSP1177-20130426/9663_1 /TAXON_ID=2985 /ORGANISM="Ochromonas sp, Strain CCMP1899" /LENGTH=352 /DNA_ID=CAMNT_0007004401 /DNA_START=55 /DNA_END=1116 /DNA_ORIENTATION=+
MSTRLFSSKTLIVATSKDPASWNIANALIDSSPMWNTQKATDSSSIYCTKTSDLTDKNGRGDGNEVWLWMQDQQLLYMNDIDDLMKQELQSTTPAMNIKFDDVIFLSRHSAASGQASLTVHPIGIPWSNDATESGGLPGRCSPPSRRIAELYRAIYSETTKRGMQDQFEVTLEATHHGPFASIPACFVEIGSTEVEWGIPEAGKIWADCLLKHLRIRNVLDDSSSYVPDLVDDSNGVVMVSIGGGHYVPKMNDVARYGAGMYTGHSLATYALQRHLDGTHRDPIEGGWQHIIKEAIESTKQAHLNAQLIVLLDKKAFISEHKKSIISYLEENDIKWTHKVTDVKKLWEDMMR